MEGPVKKQDQISETAIALLVRRFYTKVHGDPLLAPFFTQRWALTGPLGSPIFR